MSQDIARLLHAACDLGHETKSSVASAVLDMTEDALMKRYIEVRDIAYTLSSSMYNSGLITTPDAAKYHAAITECNLLIRHYVGIRSSQRDIEELVLQCLRLMPEKEEDFVLMIERLVEKNDGRITK